MKTTFDCLIVALLAYSYSGNAWSADVEKYFATDRAPAFVKTVQSFRERKYNNLVQQQYDYSCGAAAVATILRYSYTLRVDEKQIIEGMLAVSDEQIVRTRGFSLLDIKNYLERVGFRGRGYQVNPDLLAKIKVPTIALIDTGGYQHFVVLRKVVDDLVFIADPAQGNKIISLSEFSEGWEGVLFAIIGDGYERRSRLANPRPPLSLKKNRDNYLPATDLELVEFGFQRKQIL